MTMGKGFSALAVSADAEMTATVATQGVTLLHSEVAP